MTPAYPPGDVLHDRGQNFWKVTSVLTVSDIYTLHALAAADEPVSVTLTGMELKGMGVKRVTRMPEEVRAEATAAALAGLGLGEDPQGALSRL